MMEVFICDAIRTPVGKYGGMLSSVRIDDLAAVPLKDLIKRNLLLVGLKCLTELKRSGTVLMQIAKNNIYN